jgi:hypothetical protein
MLFIKPSEAFTIRRVVLDEGFPLTKDSLVKEGLHRWKAYDN